MNEMVLVKDGTWFRCGGGGRGARTWLSQTSLSHSYAHRPYGPVLSAAVTFSMSGMPSTRTEDGQPSGRSVAGSRYTVLIGKTRAGLLDIWP